MANHFLELLRSDIHLFMVDPGLKKFKERSNFIYTSIFVFYSPCRIKCDRRLIFV